MLRRRLRQRDLAIGGLLGVAAVAVLLIANLGNSSDSVIAAADPATLAITAQDGEPVQALSAIDDGPGQGEVPDGDLEVVFHRPTSEAPYHNQIQVGFDAPLIPLSSIDDESRQEALSHFSLNPPAPGTFRFVGPQAVVFSPETTFPPATRYTVTISEGLTDVHGRQLAEAFTWQFHTAMLHLSFPDRRNSDGENLDLEPELVLESSGALDLGSLRERISLVRVTDDDGTEPVDVRWTVKADADNPPAVQEPGTYRRDYVYHLEPTQVLEKATDYRIRIAAGVRPDHPGEPTGSGTTFDFSTYGPLAFEFDTDKNGGRWHKDEYFIRPTTDLDKDTLEGEILLDPPIEGEPVWSHGHSSLLYLADGELRPDTEYTVTVGTGVRDVHGQRLSEPWTHTFRTSHLRTRIQVDQGLQLVTPRTEALLPFRAVNPGGVSVSLLPVPAERFAEWALGPDMHRTSEIMEQGAARVRQFVEEYDEDAVEVRDVPFGRVLNDAGRGLVVFDLEASRRVPSGSRPVRGAGAILRTNLALHARMLPSELHVIATHLTDGSAASGCDVEVYYDPEDEGDAELIATGRTDGDGWLKIPAEELGVRATGESLLSSRPEEAAIVVSDGDDFAFLCASGPLRTRVGGYYTWESSEPLGLGDIFSDRQLYQPGDDVSLKGVLRVRRGGLIETPDAMPLDVTLETPTGVERDLGQVTTDEYGCFSLEVTPEPGDPLGYYDVVARNESTGVSITGSFRRADFNPPRYKTDLSTEQSVYTVGERINMELRSEYLFGAPLAGGGGQFRVNIRGSSFRPDGWPGFQFSIPSWIADELSGREAPEKTLVDETRELDDDGFASVSVPVVAEDVPVTMAYELSVGASDVSGQTVGDAKTVTVLPHGRITGVRLGSGFVSAGSPCTAQVIAVDPQGEALSGVALEVELLSLDWVEKEIEDEDRVYTEWVLEPEVVATERVRSDDEAVTVELTPSSAGSHLVVARLAGVEDPGTEGAAWLYVTGTDISEGKPGIGLDIYVDRDEYQVGDEVQVAIESPFDEARLLLSVEREKVFEQQSEVVGKGIATYSFTITDEMIPNLYVHAMLTEMGPEDGNLFGDPDSTPYRRGSEEVSVSRDSHRLDVEVLPHDDECRPGDTTTVDFRVEDHRARPAPSQLTVMVVDEAILQMNGYRPPDLVRWIFRHRGHSLHMLDNRPWVVHAEEHLKPPPKGWGYDGGPGGAGTPGTYLREDFERLAYFNADLRTDSQGHASCEFELPDSLTTWRVLAVAVGRENDFGQGDNTFVVNQPLMLNGLLPRFARVDDEITAGVSINNQTGGPGHATVQLTMPKGEELLEGDSAEDTVGIAPNRTAAVRFPHVARGMGEAALEFECVFEGDGIREVDRLRLPLIVEEPAFLETVAVATEIGNARTFPIELSDLMRQDVGAVNVSLSSTAFGNLAPEIEYLIRYPYGCAEQVGSIVYGLLAAEEPMRRYGFEVEPEEPLADMVQAGISDILACQTYSGGFSYWAGSDHASRWLSCYIAVVLAEARDHGYSVPEDAMEQLAGYLESTHVHDLPRRSLLHFRCQQAVALSALGHEYTEHYGTLVQGSDELSLIDRMRLARVLSRSPEWRGEATELYEDVQERSWMTARGVQIQDSGVSSLFGFYSDSTAALTAEGLQLSLLMEPAGERPAMMASSLVSRREHRRYRTTYGSAQVLHALSEYMEAREATPPDFTALLELDGAEETSMAFQGFELGRRTYAVPLSELGLGTHQLTIHKNGAGSLYSTVELEYAPAGETDPRCEGFFIERTMTNMRTGQVIDGVDDEILVGDMVRVELMVNSPQDAPQVVVESPVPAGLEPVDTSFATTPQWAGEGTSSTWRWDPFNRIERHKDHIALFAQAVPPGVYSHEYVLQATNPGEFSYPATRIYRMYEPEEYGATGSSRVRVGES
ncbi:MAG: hypothetical protein GF320_06800 [Armatimonadia bacterium]|nr:hypothetical protein [Armatimonadia bacterium]